MEQQAFGGDVALFTTKTLHATLHSWNTIQRSRGFRVIWKLCARRAPVAVALQEGRGGDRGQAVPAAGHGQGQPRAQALQRVLVQHERARVGEGQPRRVARDPAVVEDQVVVPRMLVLRSAKTGIRWGPRSFPRSAGCSSHPHAHGFWGNHRHLERASCTRILGEVRHEKYHADGSLGGDTPQALHRLPRHAPPVVARRI